MTTQERNRLVAEIIFYIDRKLPVSNADCLKILDALQDNIDYMKEDFEADEDSEDDASLDTQE